MKCSRKTFQYLTISFGSEPEGSGRRGIQEISIDGSNKNKNTCQKLRLVVTCNLSTSCKGGTHVSMKFLWLKIVVILTMGWNLPGH